MKECKKLRGETIYWDVLLILRYYLVINIQERREEIVFSSSLVFPLLSQHAGVVLAGQNILPVFLPSHCLSRPSAAPTCRRAE